MQTTWKLFKQIDSNLNENENYQNYLLSAGSRYSTKRWRYQIFYSKSERRLVNNKANLQLMTKYPEIFKRVQEIIENENNC